MAADSAHEMPADQYVVTIAKYGTRNTVRSDVFLNYPVYHQDDGPIQMDYFVWVLRNGERTIVVDTGFSRHGGAVRNRQMLIDPPELFALLGVHPDDAPLVLITHAHFDHIGNLKHFPRSPMVLSEVEYRFWQGEHAQRALFHHSVEDDELVTLASLVNEGRVELFSGRREVAPGVELVELGGHTPGQSVVIVQTSDGPVLLASDAIHYYEEYEADMPFTSVADLVGMYDAFDTIRRMVASGEVRHLVSGHDPATLERFAAVEGELAGFVATIGAAA